MFIDQTFLLVYTFPPLVSIAGIYAFHALKESETEISIWVKLFSFKYYLTLFNGIKMDTIAQVSIAHLTLTMKLILL